MKGAQLIVECLRAEGVEHIFTLPGSSFLEILDALYSTPEIKLIVTRHEQVAASAADGYARVTGKQGVCLVGEGPGASNAVIGIHTAYVESSPVVLLIGEQGTDIIGRPSFQELDFVSLFRPITKWRVQINRADRLAELLHRAFHTALAGRPRPVAVTIPADLQVASLEAQPYLQGPISVPSPDPQALEATADMLLAARRPVILAGGGAVRSGATPELVRLAESLAIPVIATLQRDDVFPNDHPLYLGAAGAMAVAPTVHRLYNSDVLLAVGCRFSQLTTSRFTGINRQSKIVHIDIDPEEIGKTYSVEVGVVSDAKVALQALNEIVADRLKQSPFDKETRLKELAPIKEEYEKAVIPSLIGEKVPADLVIAELQKAVDKDAIIVTEGSAASFWVSRYYRFRKPGTFVAPANGTMGFGLPAALGVKVAKLQRQVVLVTGDGCFMMTMQDLETLVRHDLPVVIIVMNNFFYGSVKEKQLATYGRAIATDYTNPNFANIAREFGAYGEQVTVPEQMGPALRRALDSGRPAVLDVIIDPYPIYPPGTMPRVYQPQ